MFKPADTYETRLARRFWLSFHLLWILPVAFILATLALAFAAAEGAWYYLRSEWNEVADLWKRGKTNVSATWSK